MTYTLALTNGVTVPAGLERFEYSPDNGANWYTGTKTLGDVTYTYAETESNGAVTGATVKVSVDDGNSAEGSIRFRAVSRALTVGEDGAAEVNVTGAPTAAPNFQIDKVVPAFTVNKTTKQGETGHVNDGWTTETTLTASQEEGQANVSGVTYWYASGSQANLTGDALANLT